MVGKFKIENPKNIWIDEFICLRSKTYSFKCKNNDKNKNKTKRISKTQSKNFKFEEYKKCLAGEENQREYDNYIIRSFIHGMDRQKLKNQQYLFPMINDII